MTRHRLVLTVGAGSERSDHERVNGQLNMTPWHENWNARAFDSDHSLEEVERGSYKNKMQLYLRAMEEKVHFER